MRLVILITAILLLGCDSRWNNPYPSENTKANILFSAFSERPKHLDPAISYSSSEWTFVSQIYEPPLQYHYLKRPYTLEPLTAAVMPRVDHYDKNGKHINSDEDVAYSIYTIQIKKGIMYQPHPAFVKNWSHLPEYHNLSKKQVLKYKKLSDFKKTATRELTAHDYVYQIKRLASPKLNSPIFGFLSDYIDGFDKLRQTLEESKMSLDNFINLEFSGAKVIDDYKYQIKIKGKYPQFIYWLAMPFFAPMPFEADQFYLQDGMSERNITIDWYPVGTGPYMLTENNPDRRMVLVKNPNFRNELYPSSGNDNDKTEGLLKYANQKIPFLDKIIFSLEKENVPYWNKFLQGYYDSSGISSDNFDNAINFTPNGGIQVTKDLEDKGIRLSTSVSPSTMYWGFNMLDKDLGGYSLKNINLRKAISIAFDVEEFISIFTNGRGIPANSPLPPGIFGYDDNKVNPIVYDAVTKKRKDIKEALKYMELAGYKDGRDIETGTPLTIYFDTISSGDPDEKSIHAWITKQFEKLGIQLVVRATDYNRFQDKIKNGNYQFFFWGWNADYPDPENFLFMLYSKNAKVNYGGENAVNYQNAEYDNLFNKMRTMKNNEERQKIISQMINIIQNDCPWIFGYHPKSFTLYHKWNAPTKPNTLARNTLKYVKVDPMLRSKLQINWNSPIIWPLSIIISIILLLMLPAFIGFYIKEYRVKKRFKIGEKN